MTLKNLVKLLRKIREIEKNIVKLETEWLIVAGWRVFGGLGLLCGGKKFLGQADFEPFQPFWKKFLWKTIRIKRFFCSFE